MELSEKPSLPEIIAWIIAILGIGISLLIVLLSL
jgi:hypothetical protein